MRAFIHAQAHACRRPSIGKQRTPLSASTCTGAEWCPCVCTLDRPVPQVSYLHAAGCVRRSPPCLYIHALPVLAVNDAPLGCFCTGRPRAALSRCMGHGCCVAGRRARHAAAHAGGGRAGSLHIAWVTFAMWPFHGGAPAGAPCRLSARCGWSCVRPPASPACRLQTQYT